MPPKPKPPTYWREKLEREQKAVISEIQTNMQHQYGKGTILIPRPIDVDALMQKIPKGKLVIPIQLRQKLAEKYETDVTCAMTTGIFIRIVSEAAEEDLRNGKKKITPYWRVVNNDGSLRAKTPGGMEHQKELLEQEGHTIIPVNTKKRFIVQDFEKCLVKKINEN